MRLSGDFTFNPTQKSYHSCALTHYFTLHYFHQHNLKILALNSAVLLLSLLEATKERKKYDGRLREYNSAYLLYLLSIELINKQTVHNCSQATQANYVAFLHEKLKT